MIEAKLKAQRSNDSSSMRKSSSKNSESSLHSHMESPHSPLRFHSPLRSDAGDPPETPPYASPDTSLRSCRITPRRLLSLMLLIRVLSSLPFRLLTPALVSRRRTRTLLEIGRLLLRLCLIEQ